MGLICNKASDNLFTAPRWVFNFSNALLTYAREFNWPKNRLTHPPKSVTAAVPHREKYPPTCFRCFLYDAYSDLTAKEHRVAQLNVHDIKLRHQDVLRSYLTWGDGWTPNPLCYSFTFCNVRSDHDFTGGSKKEVVALNGNFATRVTVPSGISSFSPKLLFQ